MPTVHCLAPSLDVARRMVRQLLRADIPERCIRVLGSDRDALIRAGLNQVDWLEETDFGAGLERGAWIGGLVGLGLGGLCLALPVPELRYNSWLVIIGCLLGMAVGGWVGATQGLQRPNRRFKSFQQRLATDHYLLIIDLPRQDLYDIVTLLRRRYPDAELLSPEED